MVKWSKKLTRVFASKMSFHNDEAPIQESSFSSDDFRSIGGGSKTIQVRRSDESEKTFPFKGVQFIFAKSVYFVDDLAAMRKWRQYIQRGEGTDRPRTMRSKSCGNLNPTFDLDQSTLDRKSSDDGKTITQSNHPLSDQAMFVSKAELDQILDAKLDKLMGAITNELNSQRLCFQSQPKAQYVQVGFIVSFWFSC